MANNKRNLYSIGKAAEYLNVSIDTLRRWEKKGKIESLRSPGNHRYFTIEDLDKLFGKKYEHDKKNRKATITSKKETEEIKEPEKYPEEMPPNQTHTQPSTQISYAPIAYPTIEIPKVDSIVDRPIREVQIPDIKLIRVVQTKEEISIAESQIKENTNGQAKASILTPVNLEIKSHQNEQKPAEVNSQDKSALRDKSKNKFSFGTYIVIATTVLIVIAAIFFFIGATSRGLLSPVP